MLELLYWLQDFLFDPLNMVEHVVHVPKPLDIDTFLETLDPMDLL